MAFAEGRKVGDGLDPETNMGPLIHARRLEAMELRTVLGDSRALSRGLVLHSDIARSRTAFAAYAAAITPLAPGSFLRTDGLLSIRRSWTPSELTRHLAADPAYAGWRVERPAPFRLLLTSSAEPRGAS